MYMIYYFGKTHKQIIISSQLSACFAERTISKAHLVKSSAHLAKPQIFWRKRTGTGYNKYDSVKI